MLTPKRAQVFVLKETKAKNPRWSASESVADYNKPMTAIVKPVYKNRGMLEVEIKIQVYADKGISYGDEISQQQGVKALAKALAILIDSHLPKGGAA